MEELTSSVKTNANAAAMAANLAVNACDTAQKGGVMMEHAIGTMREISASSRKIADIISVIDSIAFLTNILALNAAVEAARAGEQGRGFAVVAAEVRSLAQRSATAAKEIKALITHSVDKVDSGHQEVNAAGATMLEIVESIRRVRAIVDEISATSQQQSGSIGDVNDSVAQMDRNTQQNASLVEQSSAAAESLRDAATGLVQAMGVFKVSSAFATDTVRANQAAATV